MLRALYVKSQHASMLTSLLANVSAWNVLQLLLTASVQTDGQREPQLHLDNSACVGCVPENGVPLNHESKTLFFVFQGVSQDNTVNTNIPPLCKTFSSTETVWALLMVMQPCLILPEPATYNFISDTTVCINSPVGNSVFLPIQKNILCHKRRLRCAKFHPLGDLKQETNL